MANISTKVEEVEEESGELVVAGPTAPLAYKRVQTLIPCKFSDEPLDLVCEWQECEFRTASINSFMDHVALHIPYVEIVYDEDGRPIVYLHCNWNTCPWKTDKKSEDLQRHLFLHAYHTKLKCIGSNTINRGSIAPCKADANNRNILPDLSENLVCAWDNCTEKFINIQLYYDHIRLHCEDHPKLDNNDVIQGRNVSGGIRCLWSGCSSNFCNITKLRDHMRSHTQEKLLACPVCGGLFSNRTRFFDHCRRQGPEQNFACDVCMKCFSTARLLRDHIRSHVNTYRCASCEMSCSSPSALNSHIRYRHSDVRLFLCETCDYAAKSHSDLTRHVKVHSQPVYRCEEEDCAYESKSMTSLSHHWDKAHSEAKPRKYACHLCDKRFSRGYYLTKHMIAVHKLQWPSGHSRFRYKLHPDGLCRLLTVRYESVEVGAIQSETSTSEVEIPETILPDLDPDQDLHEEQNIATLITIDSPMKLEPMYMRQETEIQVENY